MSRLENGCVRAVNVCVYDREAGRSSVYSDHVVAMVHVITGCEA